MKYDTTLKDLLGRGAPALLRQLVGSAAAEFDLTEYPATRSRRPDLVARLEDGRLFHLELQGAADPRMAWRMLEYYLLIAEAHGDQPVVQMVLALSDAAAAAMPSGITHPTLASSFRVVSAEGLDAAPLLASDRSDDNVRAILGRLAGLDENERRDAAVRLLVLSGLRRAAALVMEEVTAMGIQIDIESNEYLRDIFAQGEARGEARGRAEGKAEGKAEMLLRQLGRRFGGVPEPRRAQVLAAASDQLDAWADALFEAQTLDDVFVTTAH